MRLRDLSPHVLGALRAVVFQSRDDSRRPRDAIERAAHGVRIERQPEGVGRDLLETMRLVHHQVLGRRQQRAVHARVLQQERVVRDDDARSRCGLARALQVAAAGHARAAASIARLVISRDA